jgi:hypothetical protein
MVAAPSGVAIFVSLVGGSIDMDRAPLLVTWTAWTDAKSEKAARVVAARLFATLDHAVENEAFARYGKTGGWRFTFRTQLNAATRNDGVVVTIALGMRVGYSWVLSGDVYHGLEGWSNAARIAGITNLQWQIINEMPESR